MKLLKMIGLSLAIIFGGLVTLAFLIGFVDGVLESLHEDDKPTTSKVETPKPEVTPVPAPVPKEDTKVTLKSDKYAEVLPNAKTIFTEGCTGENSPASTCGCMYDWLDNNLTNAEFGKLIEESTNGVISDHMWSAAKACVTI